MTTILLEKPIINNHVNFKRVLITPAIAKQILESNISNRRSRTKKVDEYAKEMFAGRWKENTGDTIKIAKDGTLLDGQHRLLALIKANVSLYFHLAENLENDVFTVLDTGLKRNPNDVLHIAGVTRSNVIASIIGAYLIYKTTRINSNRGVHQNQKASHTLILSEYELRPNYWHSVCIKTERWYKQFAKLLRPSVIGSIYVIFSERDADLAELFFEQLTSGVGIKNNTIYTLRNRLIQNGTSKISKLSPIVVNAMIIKTWNALRDGTEIKTLKFNSVVESFPKIK